MKSKRASKKTQGVREVSTETLGHIKGGGPSYEDIWDFYEKLFATRIKRRRVALRLSSDN